MTARLPFLMLSLVSVVLLACEDEVTKKGVSDGDTDSGTDSASDGDVDGDADADADADGDTDADGDADEEIVLHMDCSDCPSVGSSIDNMLCAFDICDESLVLGNEIDSPMDFILQCALEDTFEAVEHFGDTDNGLSPRLNNSYALMATGKANPVDQYHSDDCVHSTTIDGMRDPHISDDAANVYDPVEWKITLKAPSNARGFRFKYVFFSTEYDDKISSPYNDKFYVILNAPETTGGTDKVINYTDCRDHFEYYDFSGEECDTPSGFCCYIAINSAFSDCCWYPYMSYWVDNSPSLEMCPGGNANPTDISGTGFECATDPSDDEAAHGSSTGWVQTSWPIRPDEEFTLTFHLHDTEDAHWDSEVILDSFQFLTEEEQGTVEIIIE